MSNRYTIVNEFKIRTLSFSAVLQIGDSKEITSQQKALAVQRERELFFSSEGNFDLYPVFQEPIPFPSPPAPINFSKIDECPISVKKIDITGSSFSSVLHLGQTGNVYMEARVKNIRQLRTRGEE
ncbi:MAG: spore germination protein GerPE [Bacillota bacterium]